MTGKRLKTTTKTALTLTVGVGSVGDALNTLSGCTS